MKGESPRRTLGLGLIHAVPGETQANKAHLNTPFSFQVLPGSSRYLCSYMRNVFCSALVVLWICSALNSPSSGLYFFQLSYFMDPGSFHPALYPPEQRLSRIQSLSLLPSHAQSDVDPHPHISLLSCGSICRHFPLFSVCHLDHVTTAGARGLGDGTCCPLNFTSPLYKLVSEVSLDQQ